MTPQPMPDSGQPALEGSQPESMSRQPASEFSQVCTALSCGCSKWRALTLHASLPVQEQDGHAEPVPLPLTQQQHQQPTDEVLKAQADVAAAVLHQLGIQETEQAGNGAEAGEHTGCILISRAAKMSAHSP